MRVTNNMLVNNMINNIGTNLGRMSKFQDQLATGKKIQVPSDDPVVAARALKLRTDVSEVSQYQKNITDAQSWLDTTETTLGQIGDVLGRVRDLAVQAANGTNTPDDRQKIQAEAGQLKNQLVQLANTSYAGRYIFSGFQTDKPLMNPDGSFALDVNNSEQIKFQIGMADSINVNVTGGDLFNNGANATTAIPTTPPTPPNPPVYGSMIQDIDKFINGLYKQGSVGPPAVPDSSIEADISKTIDNMDVDTQNILRLRADVGARQNRLELTANRMDSDTLNFTKLMSDNEDVDMSETIMNLKNEENVYKASLSGGARIIQPSLIDFLR